jgi:dTDP-4-amino-4,6-dideoxygalactose transaminase
MEIPFLDLKRQYEEHKNEINSVVLDVLASGWYILGKECEKFELNFKNYLAGKEAGYVVGVNSGTDALRLSLMASGVEVNSEVITVANTAIPTVSAICSVGAKPVFCEVEEKTWLMDPNKLEELITEKTKAIIPVHLYGFCADMDKINEIAQKNNLKVIEDVAQATGAIYGSRKAGTIGDYGAFSFYPSKNLGACGDGGAIFIKNKERYDKLIKLRNYGQSSKYISEIENGINSRLDEIQAAILNFRIKYIDGWNQSKMKLAQRYINKFKSLKVPVQFQDGYDKVIPQYHLFVIKLLKGDRDNLKNILEKQGVQTLIHYPISLYDQSAFKKYKKCKLEVTEDLTKNILSLPLNPYMTEIEVDYIVEIIARSLNT